MNGHANSNLPNKKLIANLLVAIIVFALAPNAKAVATDVARPNVILIVADDMGYADMGTQGAVGFNAVQAPVMNAPSLPSVAAAPPLPSTASGPPLPSGAARSHAPPSSSALGKSR